MKNTDLILTLINCAGLLMNEAKCTRCAKELLEMSAQKMPITSGKLIGWRKAFESENDGRIASACAALAHATVLVRANEKEAAGA